MADLKLDLVNNLNNEKYYEEIELIRLAADQNANYKDKIEIMSLKLETIALVNAKLGLIEQYFKENVPAPQNASAPEGEKVAAPTGEKIAAPTGEKIPPVAAPEGQAHQGQSHSE